MRKGLRIFDAEAERETIPDDGGDLLFACNFDGRVGAERAWSHGVLYVEVMVTVTGDTAGLQFPTPAGVIDDHTRLLVVAAGDGAGTGAQEQFGAAEQNQGGDKRQPGGTQESVSSVHGLT